MLSTTELLKYQGNGFLLNLHNLPGQMGHVAYIDTYRNSKQQIVDEAESRNVGTTNKLNNTYVVLHNGKLPIWPTEIRDNMKHS